MRRLPFVFAFFAAFACGCEAGPVRPSLAYEAEPHLSRAGLALPVLLGPTVEARVWQKGCLSTCGTKPPAGIARAVFDPRLDRVVVLAGSTYAWDGALWSTLAPAEGPMSTRSNMALVFHASVGSMVAQGGDGSGCVGGYCNDTWTWDYTSNAWTSMANLTTPADLTGRRNAATAYDEARQQMVLFGGEMGTPSDAGLVNSNLRETWVLASAGESVWVWTKKASTTLPPARNNARMVYDSKRQRVLLFGGWGSDPVNYTDGGVLRDGPMNDLWVWDGTSWSELTPASKPPRRTTFGFTYDARRDRAIAFGGWGVVSGTLTYCDDVAKNCNRLGDTWEFDGIDWAQVATASAPEARVGMELATDALRGHVVGFGGWADPNSDETWEYYTRGAACDADAASSCPSGTCVDGVCCEATSCGECKRCDTPTNRGACAPVSHNSPCSHGICQAGVCSATTGDASPNETGPDAPDAPGDAAPATDVMTDITVSPDAGQTAPASSSGCSLGSFRSDRRGATWQVWLLGIAAIAFAHRRRRGIS